MLLLFVFELLLFAEFAIVLALSILIFDPPLEVEEITMLPLDPPELPPPKKPPPKKPPPPPPRKPPPVTIGTAPLPPTKPDSTSAGVRSGMGDGVLETVTTAGAHAAVTVRVTTRRWPRIVPLDATRMRCARLTSLVCP